MMNKGFGPHVMLDLNQCCPKRCQSVEQCFELLNQLPIEIGMTKITQPYVFPYSGLVPEDKGVTGFVVIAESHISIHTFPLKEYVFIDIFSCKPFNTTKGIEIAINAFNSKDPMHHVVTRGLHFESKDLNSPCNKLDAQASTIVG